MATPRRGADDERTAMGLSLRGWALEAEAAAGIAKAVAGTAFVPDHLRVWINPAERDPSKKELDFDRTVQQVAAVLLAGQELGLEPMASLRAFVIIRGTVALFAVAARALLQQHGHEVIVVESTSTRAIVRGRRAGSEHWQQSVWDIDRAKTAGLFPGHPEGNWRKHTKSMLVARASAEVARWIASDAMLGLPLLAEEVEDGDEIPVQVGGLAADGAASTSPPAEEPTAKRTTTAKRKTATPKRALPAASAPPPPVAPPAPVPEEERPEPGKPSKPQLAAMHAGLRDAGVVGRERGLALVSVLVNRQVDSTANLTAEEVSRVLDALATLRPVTGPGDGEEPADDAEPDRG